MADSLRDQLLKAGLVSEKQARKATHERRVERADKGHAAVEAEKKAQAARQQAELAARREQDRQREVARRAEEEARAQRLRVAQIVESGRIGGPVRGPRRFYFQARGDRLPFVEVSEEIAGRLERGAAAIAESPERQVTLIEGEAAARVAALDRAWLRHWRGPG